MPSLSVVKVGGSLFDLPDLGRRLNDWLACAKLGSVLLVPGGGALADAVRELDRLHKLGEEKSHWLALRALTVNAHLLAELLPHAQVVTSLPAVTELASCAILDCHGFARADDTHPDRLPHSWSVTSDSVAARVAAVIDAPLILLKSVTIPEPADWHEAARVGWVDPLFPELVRNVNVRAVNLRRAER